MAHREDGQITFDDLLNIPSSNCFVFPDAEPLTVSLKDILEDQADEKYFLSDTMLKGFIVHNEKHTEKNTGFIWKPRSLNGIASTLRANGSLCPTDNKVLIENEAPKLKQVAQIYGTEKEPNPQAGRIYSPDGLSPTLDTCSGGNRMPKLLVKQATKQGYVEAYEGDGIDIRFAHSSTRRGRVQHQKAQTLQCDDMSAVVVGGLRIRRLTPRECWRLQAFSDESFNKASEVNSNTQLYKQAGNSITVRVLEKILTNLLTEINNNE